MADLKRWAKKDAMTRNLILIYLLIAMPILAATTVEARKETEKKVSFSLARPVNGTYLPYLVGESAGYAGEIITITGDQFRYQYYTDVADEPTPDYSGKITFSEDRLFLDHPGVNFPYRIAGVMDGVPVLLIWPVFQKLKETGRRPEYGVLYLHKEAKEPNQPPEPMPLKRHGSS